MIVHQAPAELAHLGPLPVRVRKATGEVVGSGVTGAPITVPTGSYYVTVQTPDGREIGTDHRVRCASPEAAGAVLPVAAAALLGDVPLAPAAAAIPTEQTASLRLWKGDWLGELARGISAEEQAGGEHVELSSRSPRVIPFEPGCDRLLIQTLADRYRCTIIPYDECIVCLDESDKARAIGALLTDGPDGPLVDYRSTVSEQTNGLLGFVESGILSNMVAVTEDQVRRGEGALIGQGASVLRAITGAYILLRANLLDGVEDWLDRLEPLCADLPDVCPLRMELFARRGEHKRAVEALIATIGSGRCPWFRAGLSYMLERLRLYIDVSENKGAPFNLSRIDYLSFRAARDGLERLLPMMITTRYIATFDLPLTARGAT